MEDLLKISLKAIGKIVEEDLAALLAGCLLTIFLIVKYYKIPDKWEYVKKRLISIEHKLSDLLKRDDETEDN